MNRHDYIGQIEKLAAEDMSQKSLPAKIKDSYLEMKVNDAKKGALKMTGAAIGTGLALKSGAPLGKAITSGGIRGMAIGDIAGSAVIPTADLYRKHKQEFGTAPDINTVGKLVASNVLPTAGFWGAVYGTKAGLKYRKNMASGIEKGIGKVKQSANNVSSIMGDQGYLDELATKLTSQDPSIVAQAKADNTKKIFSAIKDPFVSDFGANGKGQTIGGLTRGVLGAAAPAVAMEALNIPAAYATPSNLISAKKRRMEQGDING